MKIASADLSLSAARLSTSRVEVSERLRAWVGARPTEDADRPTPRSVVVSNAARQALDLDKSAATDAAGKIDGEDADIDPRLALIKSIVEMMTGRRIEVMSTTDMATGEAASQPAPPPPDFGIEYDRTETRETFEASTFEASGTIRTADGKDINFSVGLSMSRSETETSSVSLRAGKGSVDVAAMARRFGGGGHAAAAGFKLALGTAECRAFIDTYIAGPGERHPSCREREESAGTKSGA